MKRKDLIRKSNLKLIQEKYEILDEQEIITNKELENITINNMNLDQFFTSMSDLQLELERPNRLEEYDADEVDEEDLEQNKVEVEATLKIIKQILELKSKLYKSKEEKKINYKICCVLAEILELIYELNYSTKKVWCCGNIENIDSCMEKIFINFYESIGVNLESTPLEVNNSLYNAILKITINPYWG